MPPAERAAELRETLERLNKAYYQDDEPLVADDEYDALLDELRALEAQHPELLTPDSPTQKVGAEPVSRLEKVTHLQPMLSLANARSEEELRAWIERMRNHLAREGIEDAEFRYVAEPKIDGLAISLLYKDGQLVRGATRGNGEVGEDVQHNLRQIPTIPHAIERRPAARRGPRRGLHEPARLRRAQRAPRRRGPVDVHEPAQLGGGDDPPARPQARQGAPAELLGLRRRRHRGAALRSPLRGAGLAARPRLPGQRRHRGADDRGGGRRALPALGAAPRRPRVRDRRCRRQGRRHRAAAPARGRRARPTLGDRLEVPADHQDDEAARRRVERGQVRRPAPVRAPGAGARRRRHREQGDPAQRGGPRSQGHPRRRRGDHPARRRRDPAGGLPGPARRRAQGPLGAARAAGALPGVRHADGQARGNRLHPLPQPGVPGAPVAAARPLGRRAARWTSTAWGRSRSAR